MEKVFITKSPEQTKKLGEIFAKVFQKLMFKNQALVLGLEGDLGGGKTTFVQGFARGLKIKEKILSPTFILIKKFDIKYQTFSFKHFYHIDCYRIEDPKEILNLDFKKIINDPKNVVLIEWADKIQKILPKKTFFLKFEFLGRKKRRISFYLK